MGIDEDQVHGARASSGRADVIVSGTTRGMRPGEDYTHFCDDVGDVYVGVRPEPTHRAFVADYALHRLGPFALGMIATPGVSAHRDRVSISRVADDALFVNHSPRAWRLRQGRGDWVAAQGGALVLDNAAPFDVIADPSRRLALASLRIPRDALSAAARDRLREVNDRLAGGPSSSLIGAQMALLVSATRTGEVGVAIAMANVVVQMLEESTTKREPMAWVRVEAVQAYARMRLRDPRLNIGEAALALGCSVRTVQLAFAGEGETFSAWLRAERLDAARAEIRSDEARYRPIAAIAADYGFTDMSTFYRAYRARFSTTPAADR
ncbi:MAG: AraC family transcriptional regulator [Microbacterium sp.]|uniref:AraC family transcriptional regulator n=1 Tax=Microbacterium sp. TaxID=51671 RepID=UPI00324286AC